MRPLARRSVPSETAYLSREIREHLGERLCIYYQKLAQQNTALDGRVTELIERLKRTERTRARHNAIKADIPPRRE